MAEEQEGDHPAPIHPTRSSLSNLIGTTLTKYRLVERLGQGGMAQVYKAYQPDLDRYVAVKVLHPHLTSDEEFTARFRREARAVAALEHPHSIRIYDFDTDNGLAFLVMEYLTGTSLKAQLRELKRREELMDLEQVGRIIGALADALDYAHRRGVVHRDIKPSNVLITTDGRPVLTDFGIARIVDSTVITGSSGAMGTPAYMSPEQGKGEPGDARSDIYALGVMLYQLCTGHLPFDADTPYAIILKHLTAPLAPPRSLRPDLPQALERVILKSLAKNPDDRYQTAREMGRAVRAAIELDEVSRLRARITIPFVLARVSRIFSRRRLVWQGIAWVAITILVCIALFILSTPWRVERYLTRLTLTPAEVGMEKLVLDGPDAFIDTWLDPDRPDEVWHSADRAKLRGPDKADRILIGINMSRLSPDTNVYFATLTLRVERSDNQSPPCRMVVFRMATLWRPSTATYNSSWGKPGLLAGTDYDATPIDRVTLPERGLVSLNVTQAVLGWQKRGRSGGGLVLMLSDDSSNQCNYWVYTTEQSDPDNRPVLQIVYKVTP